MKITEQRTFSQADFDAFADLSGDNNPIHVDHEFAAESRFGRTVSHGVLLCSVIRGMIERRLPGSRQLAHTVMYPAPTFADEAMLFEIDIERASDSEHQCAFQVKRVADETVTCEGQCRVKS